MLWDEKLKKTFCCYNCLDLYHAQSFFLVFVTCFPSSLEQELGKQVTHTWKFFLTANLDNYSNKILYLILLKIKKIAIN